MKGGTLIHAWWKTQSERLNKSNFFFQGHDVAKDLQLFCSLTFALFLPCRASNNCQFAYNAKQCVNRLPWHLRYMTPCREFYLARVRPGKAPPGTNSRDYNLNQPPVLSPPVAAAAPAQGPLWFQQEDPDLQIHQVLFGTHADLLGGDIENLPDIGKTVTMWSFVEQTRQELLRFVMPYDRIKKKHGMPFALIGRHFLENVYPIRLSKHGSTPVTLSNGDFVPLGLCLKLMDFETKMLVEKHNHIIGWCKNRMWLPIGRSQVFFLHQGNNMWFISAQGAGENRTFSTAWSTLICPKEWCYMFCPWIWFWKRSWPRPTTSTQHVVPSFPCWLRKEGVMNQTFAKCPTKLLNKEYFAKWMFCEVNVLNAKCILCKWKGKHARAAKCSALMSCNMQEGRQPWQLHSHIISCHFWSKRRATRRYLGETG